MFLLDRWRRLTEVGTVIPCAEMRLDARDREAPIVIGRGEIRVVSPATYRYTVRGIPDDVGHTLRCLNRQSENPYDGLMRFRLNAVDGEGKELNAGWTIPKVQPGDRSADWVFTGDVESLWIDDLPAAEVGTEVLYLLPQQHRARLLLRRFISSADGCGSPKLEHRMEVLSTQVTFRLDDEADTLSISAKASEALPQTHTENWLGEPLRIMFGQLVFPRMVARANPDRTVISIRPTRAWHRESDWAALWDGPTAVFDKDGFWRTYAALLAFVSGARDDEGSPNFEANKLTRLYEEVIQASRGSRWMWALTFASSVEGLVRMLVPRGTPRANANTAGIADISRHIDAWTGSDPQLKSAAKAAVARTAETSAIQALRDLRDNGVVSKDQVAAWNTIRNQVMHGSLISPYSSEEDDKLLLDLAGLLHALTRRLILP